MVNTDFPELRILSAFADRHLPGSGSVYITRMRSGVSTPVYRIQRDGVTRYLRLAESPEANFAPEALVHERLRANGVSVPEIVHFEPFHPDVGRSLMVTGEIPGCSLAEQHTGIDLAEILRSAGRDLAHVQEIPVDGFGFVRRDLPLTETLYGIEPTIHAFAFANLEAHLVALTNVLTREEVKLIRRMVREYGELLEARQAVLGHGDLDATHIYHQDGRYTGIIDFGEIRGVDRWYDLGHFALHDGEILTYPLLPHLLAGYAEITPLPAGFDQYIHFWRLLIGMRALSRSITQAHTSYHAHLHTGILASIAALDV